MYTSPTQQGMNKWEIHFPNGNRAQAVSCPIGTPSVDLLSSLDIQQPRSLIMITGGASGMSEDLNSQLAQLFTHGIAYVASSVGAIIIDGGSQAGVMKMIGLGVKEYPSGLPLLGISAAGRSPYPGKRGDQMGTPLDPNHSHFILVETDKRGGETETMYELAALLSRTCPSVAVLVNGGPITVEEVVYNVRQGRPIIVIEGSGRFADKIARLQQEGLFPLSDQRMAEIVTHGNFHFFPINGTVSEFVQLALRLLGK
jgi:TRPM family ion channel